jgi:short-subunit dehydrogenase
VIAGRDPHRLEAARVALSKETGGEVRAVQADLLQDAAARALVDATLEAFSGHPGKQRRDGSPGDFF